MALSTIGLVDPFVVDYIVMDRISGNETVMSLIVMVIFVLDGIPPQIILLFHDLQNTFSSVSYISLQHSAHRRGGREVQSVVSLSYAS